MPTCLRLWWAQRKKFKPKKKEEEEEKEIQFKRKPVILKATIFQLIEKKPTEQIRVV